ncbi:aldose 1-epimerase family protein [Demequina rhizosphaerae]|uniref:aldose 1-epimerase family protein n=1 Tax=Demequina rhizosphaerae TaxID=1638985 RepID=UPI000A7BCB9E|nr:aldose 1-epimerase family protein [Demequina rhizosphaerae]
MENISGDQITISRGGMSATIATVGASLRQYQVDGTDAVVPFHSDEIAPAYHGMVLAPWPNRVRDGRYTFDGRDLQLPLNDAEFSAALHGLVSWQNWAVVSVQHDAVALCLELPASPGYPFRLVLEVSYRLSSEGLAVSATATNAGDHALPYGLGFHPWISPGTANLDDCTLELSARSRILVDDRWMPAAVVPVRDTFDFLEPRPLLGTSVCDTWVDPVRDARGRSWAKLRRPDGATVTVWGDAEVQAWQVCTGDGVPAIARSGIALEPMTCAADAFRTGERLIRIEPRAHHSLTWGIAVD